MKLDGKKFLMKFDRFCAWILIAIMAAFFITGYGQTKGIIPAQIAKFIHDTLLPIPGIIAFAFHSAYGMHISFKRWKVWNRVSLTILIVYALVLILGIIFFQFIVQVPGSGVNVPTTIDL